MEVPGTDEAIRVTEAQMMLVAGMLVAEIDAVAEEEMDIGGGGTARDREQRGKRNGGEPRETFHVLPPLDAPGRPAVSRERVQGPG